VHVMLTRNNSRDSRGSDKFPTHSSRSAWANTRSGKRLSHLARAHFPGEMTQSRIEISVNVRPPHKDCRQGQ
jgi:hypothetical protein